MTSDRITPEWVTDVLKRHGSLLTGHVIDVQQQVGTIVSDYNARLQVSYSPDATGALSEAFFFKQSQRTAEALFYQQIAPHVSNITLLECYDAQYDEAGSHLLLEFMGDTHFDSTDGLPVKLAYCQMIIDSLADLHSQFWNTPALYKTILPHAENIPTFVHQQTSGSFSVFVDYLGERLSTKRRTYLERILASFPDFCPRSPHTMVHGDTHWGNFLYPPQPNTNDLYLIDWAVWHANVGVNDIAYTVALQCYPEYRARFEKTLVRRYHERLIKNGVIGYSWDNCWEDYRRAVIFQCLWPIFWFKYQLPPAIWWTALECTMSAFDDLDCQAFL